MERKHDRLLGPFFNGLTEERSSGICFGTRTEVCVCAAVEEEYPYASGTAIQLHWAGYWLSITTTKGVYLTK